MRQNNETNLCKPYHSRYMDSMHGYSSKLGTLNSEAAINEFFYRDKWINPVQEKRTKETKNSRKETK